MAFAVLRLLPCREIDTTPPAAMLSAPPSKDGLLRLGSSPLAIHIQKPVWLTEEPRRREESIRSSKYLDGDGDGNPSTGNSSLLHILRMSILGSQ